MDREALLRAIQNAPNENTPRLMYADWLEEFGGGDRDAATVEFIRVSCSVGLHKAGLPMPKETYSWLATNWPRLIPAALNACVPTPIFPLGYKAFWQEGRKKHLRMILQVSGKDGVLGIKEYSVTFDFHRGFLKSFQTWSRVSSGVLSPLVAADQPLVGWL